MYSLSAVIPQRTLPTRRGFVNMTPEVDIALRGSEMREGLALTTDPVAKRTCGFHLPAYGVPHNYLN